MTEPVDTAMLRANAEWLLRSRGLDTSSESMEAAADEIDHLRSELAREHEINRGNGENAAWVSMHEKVAWLTKRVEKLDKRAKKLRRQRDEARRHHYETAQALAAERGGIWRLPLGVTGVPPIARAYVSDVSGDDLAAELRVRRTPELRTNAAGAV